MIGFHAADGWIQYDLRVGPIWTIIRSVGGLAAPLFITLAGISLGLRTTSSIDRGHNSWKLLKNHIAHGLQIISLGYMLRLQMWFIDGGIYKTIGGWTAGIILLSAYLAFYIGIGRTTTHRFSLGSIALITLAGPLITVGIFFIHSYWPNSLDGLFRIDILQAIGASIIIVSFLSTVLNTFRRFPHLGIFLGLVIASSTPFMRHIVPGSLPNAVAGYIAYWHPGPNKTPSTFFPLFPWVAYAFIGVSLGIYLERARVQSRTATCIGVMSVVGVVLALISCELFPYVYRWVSEHPFFLQPIRVVYRAGLVLISIGVVFGINQLSIQRCLPFQILGRASLLVYWIHLEFAFGVVSKPISHALGFREWFWGASILTIAMTVIAWIKIHAKDWFTQPEIRAHFFFSLSRKL